MKRGWIRFAALVSWPLLTAAASTPDEGAWIEAQRAAWNVPGVSVAVLHAGGPPALYASGRCADAHTACTPQTPFQAGSTTKFLTGLLAASLAADKTLRLDEPVVERWPTFRLADARWSEITLRDLLTGRSGLGSVDWPYYWDPALTRADYLARLRHVPLVQPLRARWNYANANFVAAGAYLEQVTNTPWETLLRERLFAPVELHATGFLMAPGANTGYSPQDDGRLAAVAPATTQAVGPAGSVVSTAQDFGALLQVVLDGGKRGDAVVLPPAALAYATAPAIATGYDRRYYGPPGAYGFGVFLASYHDQFVLHHGGGYPGYTAHFALLPQAGLGVVVFVNRDATTFAEALALALLDRAQGRSGDATMALWQGTQDPPPAVPVARVPAPPTRKLADYAGDYANPAWGRCAVRAAQRDLTLRCGAYTAPLTHYRYDSYSFPAAPGWERLRLKFEADYDGDIDAFDLDDGTLPPQRFVREKSYAGSLTAARPPANHCSSG